MKTSICFLFVNIFIGVLYANPRDVAIYATKMGGDRATAQPYIDKFLRYLENAIGWDNNSIRGSFFTSKKETITFIETSKPGIVMLEVPLFFELEKRFSLEPILELESKSLSTKRLNVVVKDPNIKTLVDLKGKRIWTNLAEFPDFLSKVVFDSVVNPSEVTTKQVAQPLKGARGLLRGDCDATILDDDQLASARQMEGGQDIKVIHSTQELPSIPVAVVGYFISKADKEALVRVLTQMCKDEKGNGICKEMHIERFVPVNKEILEQIRKKMGN